MADRGAELSSHFGFGRFWLHGEARWLLAVLRLPLPQGFRDLG